ncbi:MAG: Dot/Icm T4SS effector Zinc-dependent metalloprotease LegP [Chloroflexia bacterium]
MESRPNRSRRAKRDNDNGEQAEGEFRSGPVAGTALVSGMTFARKGLLYADVDGLAIFEGDIILGSVADVSAAADAGAIMLASVGISGPQFRWPNATIPYTIDPALPNQQRVTDAITHWQANTSIRFVLRTPANSAQFQDFVLFQPGGGCSSMVGRRGGQQIIMLGGGCSTGNAIHEIGHTVGLWHEQSREDRDTFVRIVWANIDPNMQHNFAQHVTDGDDLGAYDYGSCMHYPPNAFSINGQPTIVPLQALPPGVVMGQRTGLSAGDIAGVNMMYPPGPIPKVVPKDPIRDTIKEVPKDPIWDTIKEVPKDPIWDTIKEVPKDPIRDTIKELVRDPIWGGGGGGTLVEVTTQPGQFDQFGRFNPTAGVSPFITASPSRVGGGSGSGNLLAEATAQAQQLVEAIMLIEQQQAELMRQQADLVAAYEATAQALDALQQGQG